MGQQETIRSARMRFWHRLILIAGLACAHLSALAQGAGTLAFSPATVLVSEAAGSVALNVVRSGGSAGAISVSFTTLNGSAAAGIDYAATTGMLQWADGDSTPQAVFVPILQNTAVDGNRTFTVLLANATGGASIALQNGQIGLARVTIRDDEPDPFPAPGSLDGFQYYSPTNAPWTVETAFGYQSATSVRSEQAIGFFGYFYDEETGETTSGVYPGYSTMALQGDFLEGNISFAYRVASGLEGAFSFSDNSNRHLFVNGQSDWQTITRSVAKGSHYLQWQFQNFSTAPCMAAPSADGLPCTDRAYVDSIVLPPRASRLTVRVPNARGSVEVSGEAACTGPFDCSYYFAPGSTVTIQATPLAGYLFAGWSGDCAGTGPCALVMDGAKVSIAIFQPVTPTLTLSIFGDGQGTITSSPAGINCPGTCSASFAHGTSVTLAFSPAPGSTLVLDPYVPCVAANPCNLVLTDNITTYAQFLANNPLLTVTLTGSGTVVSSPPGISCPGTCAAAFPRNAVVTLTASAAPGNYGGFTNCYNPSVCSVSMYTQYTLTTAFQPGSVAAAPTIVSVTPGPSRLTVEFTPAADTGGLAISLYRATCGNASATGTTSPVIVSGLTPGMVYECTVRAVNAAGNSPASAALSGTPVPTLALLGVASRKYHGAAGPIDLPIDPSVNYYGPVSIEPRSSSGPHSLVFRFNQPVTSVALALSTSGVANYQIDNDRVFVFLSGVPDNRRVAVQLLNVGALGGTLFPLVNVAFLAGDATRSGRVSAADIIAVKRAIGKPATSQNYFLDVDASGTIDAADLALVRARAGNELLPY